MKSLSISFAIVICILFASCDGPTNVKPSEAVTVRLVRAFYSGTDKQWKATNFYPVRIENVKPQYKVGDVVELDSYSYMIEEITRKK